MLRHIEKYPVFKAGGKNFIFMDEGELSPESIQSYKTMISIMHGFDIKDIHFSYEAVWNGNVINDASPFLVQLFQERRAPIMN